MVSSIDGPATKQFKPIKFRGNLALAALGKAATGEGLRNAAGFAPEGKCVAWGIPFEIGRVMLLKDRPVTIKVAPTRAPWIVFMHTSGIEPLPRDRHGLTSPMPGQGRLAEHAADYVLIYADGKEERAAILRRFQIGGVTRRWGENCFEAVAHRKPSSQNSHPNDTIPVRKWGERQTRASANDDGHWVNWLWAWRNPRPQIPVVGIRFEPVSGEIVLSAISAGQASDHPLRWHTRRKAIVTLRASEKFQPLLDDLRQYPQIRLDMGQVISAAPRAIYPDRQWPRTDNNRLPEISPREILIEYTAHPDATFHLAGGKTVPAAKVESRTRTAAITPVEPAKQRVTINVVDKATGKPVAVKLHVHGKSGEYLAPVDRHRIPNSCWFQDYSVDFSHQGIHHCSYIDGRTEIDLPLGSVYIEVSKGFEIRPVRQAVRVRRDTTQITIELEKVLPWREKGWVTADTHVHFLSPTSALLEGAGEGINVVNLLASQWGELMTNVGDFDGKNTWGSREAGGNGEYLVRVGTENRQHVLGHISLLGYRGRIIAPMTTGGPDEAALGDPVGNLMSDWARQCREQGGLVVLPHFPNPRAENAANIIRGDVDALEMTSWGEHYYGIDPYSLSDWYRYLNCGYFVPAVGGTDKMSAAMAIGTVRTYAQVPTDRPFDYQAWMDAVRRGHTFVSYGPLMEFSVEGKPAGSRIVMTRSGGRATVSYKVATVTCPTTRVEVVVNGVIADGHTLSADGGEGSFELSIERSSWIALLVRGQYPGKAEMIAAHSSPVMIEVEGKPYSAAADAMTILQQIEGALAYLDTIGTRAETAAYKRMRLTLTAAHRDLHNRMHQAGHFHAHTPHHGHAEHNH